MFCFNFLVDVLKTESTDFETPYHALASIYDYVMRHVDYVHWVDYVESLFVRPDVVAQTILDIACGTGSLAIELNKRGYRTGGVDGCGPMLEQARTKAAESGFDIPFHHQAFLEIEGFKPHDVAVCLYDSMNYLMSLEDFAEALDRIHETVYPGGVFIFDLCTEANSVRYFSDLREREKGDGFTYSRHSYYNDGIQYNDFEITFKDPKRVVNERHRQRIYALSDIEPVLEASPFGVEATYDGFGFRPPNSHTDRVHFVLRA